MNGYKKTYKNIEKINIMIMDNEIYFLPSETPTNPRGRQIVYYYITSQRQLPLTLLSVRGSYPVKYPRQLHQVVRELQKSIVSLPELTIWCLIFFMHLFLLYFFSLFHSLIHLLISFHFQLWETE